MSLAYLILAHKSPRQVERLFRAIHHPDDLIVLHFDRRADSALHVLGHSLRERHPNVILLPARAILWGGAVMSEVQIEAMQAALGDASQWTHFINLTGQDFPLKSRDEILDRLAAQPGANFVSYFDPLATKLWKNARERLTRYNLEWPWLSRLLQVPGLGRRLRAAFGWKNSLPSIPFYRRRWPDFFRYYGGANHVVLTREACRYLSSDPAARRIIRWLHHAAHANEMTFQSVLLNSPLAATIVNDALRDIVFPSPDFPHPATVTMADLPRLLESQAFYARKFDLEIDGSIVDALENKIRPTGSIPATNSPPASTGPATGELPNPAADGMIGNHAGIGNQSRTLKNPAIVNNAVVAAHPAITRR